MLPKCSPGLPHNLSNMLDIPKASHVPVHLPKVKRDSNSTPVHMKMMEKVNAKIWQPRRGRQKPKNLTSVQLTKPVGMTFTCGNPIWGYHFGTHVGGPIIVNHTMSWSMVLQTNHAQNYHHTSDKEGVRNNSEMVARAWTHAFLQMNVTQMDNTVSSVNIQIISVYIVIFTYINIIVEDFAVAQPTPKKTVTKSPFSGSVQHSTA